MTACRGRGTPSRLPSLTLGAGELGVRALWEDTLVFKSWHEQGCAECRGSWERADRASLSLLRESVALHARLYQCKACGAYWEESERSAQQITPEAATEFLRGASEAQILVRVSGLRYPDKFAERIVPSALINVAYVSSVSDTGEVDLYPDPSVGSLSTEENQSWMKHVVLDALKYYKEPTDAVRVEFRARGR